MIVKSKRHNFPFQGNVITVKHGRVSMMVKSVMEVSEYLIVLNYAPPTLGKPTELKDGKIMTVPEVHPAPKSVLQS